VIYSRADKGGAMTDYKVLRNQRSCFGGHGKWKPYIRREVMGKLQPCRNGLHYCTDEQILGYLGEAIWKFCDLTPEETITLPEQRVTRAGMITEKYATWHPTTAAMFGVDCARTAVNRYAPEKDREALHACLDAAIGCVEGYVDDGALKDVDTLGREIVLRKYAYGDPASAAALAVRVCTLEYRHNRPMSMLAAMASSAAVAAAVAHEYAAFEGKRGAKGVGNSPAIAEARKEQYALLLRYLDGGVGPGQRRSDD